MNRIGYILVLGLLLLGCKGKKRNIPDVSGIKISLQVQRFDQDLFNVDTVRLEDGLTRLEGQYGRFMNDYLYNIMGLPPVPDSVLQALPSFLRAYRPVYDSVQVHFKNMDEVLAPLHKALQLSRYYFPQYKVPTKLITYIGPLDGYGNVLTTSGFAVGLQMYLGKDFPAYQTEYLQQIYPQYVSRRFEPAYIPVNCVKNMLDDMYPSHAQSQPLVEQMIESGKRMYLLDQLLPETADTLKTGYTASQLQGCYDHEADIWNYFVESNLLYSVDPENIRDYMGDGPKTTALGDASPGNIGLFVGWQIVKKWMGDHEKTSLITLMDTPAADILKQARYKPKG